MCGDDAIQKIAENWGKCVPKILEHGEVDSEVVNKLNMLKAIEIMDKSFRPLGAAAKSDAAFTIHEVCMCKSVPLLYNTYLIHKINSCCVKLF